jgi:hypothetical protein
VPGERVRAAVEQRPHDLVLGLEHRARDRGLPAIVGLVGIRAQPHKRRDRAGMTVVGRQHHEGVAALVVQIHRHTGLDQRFQLIGVPGAGRGEGTVGEFGHLGAVRGFCHPSRVAHPADRGITVL